MAEIYELVQLATAFRCWGKEKGERATELNLKVQGHGNQARKAGHVDKYPSN